MIPFLEIRDSSRTIIGIVDVAKSIIWHSIYYGVGDFEIYVQATDNNIALLQVGNYVTRQDNVEVGVIEQITYDFDIQEGYMITAVGRFAKSILDRRLIYKLSGTVLTPTILRGNVEIAIRQTVLDNAISCSFNSRRNIDFLGLAGLKNYPDIIVDTNGNAAQKQVSHKNLMEYTDSVLQEYGMASRLIYNDSNKRLLYEVYKGEDRSTDNTDNNEAVVFSVDYDNLNSSNYLYNVKLLKNEALVGGSGEGLDRFYSLLTVNKSGLQLREIFVDAAGVNRKYEVDGEEHEYTDAEYSEMLKQKGQEELQEHIVNETFKGEVNASYGIWQYGRDFFLGDLVTIQDNKINKYIDTRITEATEVQDDNGYRVDVKFGE